MYPELILALDEHLGQPVDSYVNGSQTWFTGEPVIEWRLHPVPGFRQPGGVSPYDLWDAVVGSLAGAEGSTLTVGGATVALDTVWECLECFPAYGDDLEPMAVIAARAAEVLPVTPDRHGLVDHDTVGDAWERAGGSVSIMQLLDEQLAG